MKKILALLALLVIGQTSAYAISCTDALGIAFTPNQRVVLCKTMGSAIPFSEIPATNNTFDLGSAALAWRTGYFGMSVVLTGANGGLFGTGANNLFVSKDSAGDLYLRGFTGATDDVTVAVRSTTGGLFKINNAADTTILTVSPITGNLAFDATNGGSVGGGIILAKSGTSIAVDSGTPASACSGTITANGATPVVTSTTCALTASRIFLSKQGPSTAVNGSCTVTAISNGVSFTVACLATDTGPYNFWITQEG